MKNKTREELIKRLEQITDEEFEKSNFNTFESERDEVIYKRNERAWFYEQAEKIAFKEMTEKYGDPIKLDYDESQKFNLEWIEKSMELFVEKLFNSYSVQERMFVYTLDVIYVKTTNDETFELLKVKKFLKKLVYNGGSVCDDLIDVLNLNAHIMRKIYNEFN